MNRGARGELFTAIDDFIPDSSKIQVVVLSPHGSTFPEVIEKLSEDNTVQLVHRNTALEAVTVVRASQSCVILFHGSENKDIMSQINMLKLLKVEIENERVRPV